MVRAANLTFTKKRMCAHSGWLKINGVFNLNGRLEHFFGSDGYRMGPSCVFLRAHSVSVCDLPQNGSYIIQKPLFLRPTTEKKGQRRESDRREESGDCCCGHDCSKRNLGLNASPKKNIFEFLLKPQAF